MRSIRAQTIDNNMRQAITGRLIRLTLRKKS